MPRAMPRLASLCLALAVLLGLLPARAASQAQIPANCVTGTQDSGARYLVCMPARWNEDLVVYAHGFVPPGQPVDIPWDQLYLPNGPFLPDMVNALGYAFATTSYRKNGLAVVEGVEDVSDLVRLFASLQHRPSHVYLVGASEGGLITTLAVEQEPEVFSGGLAACGPVGDFRGQTNYFGDFRVIFDYFFPRLLPGSPIDIPKHLMANWDEVYAPRIQDAVNRNPQATDQLLRVTRAPTDPKDPSTRAETVLGLLWYDVFATNDATAELKGQGYENVGRLYLGSYDDRDLNRRVQRFQADPVALAEMAAHYETSGRLRVPLVTIHTTGDPIVPYWHELKYSAKLAGTGSGSLRTSIPVFRYGHCQFNTSEALAAFAVLVIKVSGQQLASAETVLPSANAQAEYRRLTQDFSEPR